MLYYGLMIAPVEHALFRAPDLDSRELEVLAEISALKNALRFQLASPRRWTGALRRMSFALNIQGSNSIEGFDAKLDDADAVALGEEPLDASRETQLALEGYRNAMTYVLQLAQEPNILVDESLIKSLHFMMTSYDLTNRPGRWRAGPIFVHDERSGRIVHEGAELDDVPALMAALAGSVTDTDGDAIVRAAMAHLNLVMIHPFRDGNGRMARCLQSLVLASDGTLSPIFMSVEEFLGENTQDYYDVLAAVGGGSWQPERDARPWVRFMLTAHLRQAQTVERRIASSERVWVRLEELTAARKFPERVIGPLFTAVFGSRLRRSTYVAALRESGDEVSDQVATRDLKALTDAGFLTARGDKRGRIYTAGPALAEIQLDHRVDRFARRQEPELFADR